MRKRNRMKLMLARWATITRKVELLFVVLEMTCRGGLDWEVLRDFKLDVLFSIPA